MSVVSFVLIIVSHQINKDMPSHVESKLSKHPEVVEVHRLFGVYDLIAKVQCNSREEVGEFVINTVRNIEGVGDTKTLVGSRYE
jgi:DNA-binding Lrp family transcriptional regulator